MKARRACGCWDGQRPCKATAKLLETLSGSGTLFAETVSVGRNADVKLARAHQEQGNALVYQQLALEGDARLQNFNLWTEAESLRGCTAARLIGRGAAFEQLDAMLAGGRQKFDLNQVTVHEATDSTSRSSLRNALLGRSVGVFDGMIKIPPSGQKTDSMLEAHSMLLSDQASSNNIPGLEIEADDVKAAHSASVVHVEEEPLFYLLSRGLALEEAREMVVMGFLESLLRRLPEGFQEGLEAALDRKWRQLTAPGEGSA